MSKFEQGTRVRFTEDLSMGDFSAYFPAKGTEGTAEGSFCEYGEHGVTVLFDDGKHIDVKEDYLEHVEDPYEYAVQTAIKGKDQFLSRYSWRDSLKDAEEVFERVSDAFNRMGHKDYTARLVKRRKAGRIEDV